MTSNALKSTPERSNLETRAQRRAPRLPTISTVARRAALVGALLTSACGRGGIDALHVVADGQKRDAETDVLQKDARVDDKTDAQIDAMLADARNADAGADGGDQGTALADARADSQLPLDSAIPGDGLVQPIDGPVLADGPISPDALISPDQNVNPADAVIPADAPVAGDVAVNPADANILPDLPINPLHDAALDAGLDSAMLDAAVNTEDQGVVAPDAAIDAVVDAHVVDAFVPFEQCSVGFGPCRATGLRDQNGTCLAVPGAPGVETCNNVDDDCNGQVDDTIVPRNCATACGNGIFVCEAGGRERCTARVPAVEVCNGLDDNCDVAKQVDELLNCNDGQPCQNGVGECRRADVIAGGVCAAVPGAPTPDVCDGLDQNCDGVVDNGETRLANGQVLTGSSADCSNACGAGIRLCRAGPDGVIGLGACNAPQPSPEIIDGIDNDCDGQVDEGFGIGSVCAVGVGTCAINGHIERNLLVPGETYCETDGLVPQEPTEEICDGLDNSCDGVVDESFPESADACSRGVGACENTGLTICVNGALDCNVVAGAPQPEVCNQLDDDCDGVVDNDLICFQPGDPCSVGQGICQVPGITNADGSCNLEGRVALEQKAEICNGVDDNCDGQTDENESCAAGKLCSNGLGECKRTSTLRAAANGELLLCDAVAGAPRQETCGNDRDEDCNGEANENCPR